MEISEEPGDVGGKVEPESDRKQLPLPESRKRKAAAAAAAGKSKWGAMTETRTARLTRILDLLRKVLYL